MLISDFPISTRTKNALISQGYFSEEDFKNIFIEDLKDIKGFGNKSIVEIREYLNSKFGIVLKHKPKPKRLTDHQDCVKIVKHFLSHRKFISWPKELVTANNLLAKYGLETLLSVKPNYRASTLSFFFVADGEQYIKRFLPSIEEEEEVKVEAEEIPTQEVALNQNIFIKKPKSISDFLK